MMHHRKFQIPRQMKVTTYIIIIQLIMSMNRLQHEEEAPFPSAQLMKAPSRTYTFTWLPY